MDTRGSEGTGMEGLVLISMLLILVKIQCVQHVNTIIISQGSKEHFVKVFFYSISSSSQ